MKRGFTLAEILIALIAVGIFSILTISTFNGFYKKQHITGYKVGYQKLQSAIGEKVQEVYGPGGGVSYVKERNAQKIWKAINDSVQVQGYSPHGDNNIGSDPLISSGVIVKPDDFVTLATWCQDDDLKYCTTIGKGSGTSTVTKVNGTSPWIITEGGIAFAVESHTADPYGSSMTCGSVMEINEAHTVAEALNKSCAQIFIDVNGIHKGPNELDIIEAKNLEQVQVSQQLVTPNSQLDDFISKDRFRVYVGYDGITAGPKGYTTAGRFMYEK